MHSTFLKIVDLGRTHLNAHDLMYIRIWLSLSLYIYILLQDSCIVKLVLWIHYNIPHELARDKSARKCRARTEVVIYALYGCIDKYRF